MDTLERGKSYVLFGNFRDAEQLQKDMKEKLGINVVCIMNNVDTTVAMEYKKYPTKKKTFLQRLFNL